MTNDDVKGNPFAVCLISTDRTTTRSIVHSILGDNGHSRMYQNSSEFDSLSYFLCEKAKRGCETLITYQRGLHSHFLFVENEGRKTIVACGEEEAERDEKLMS